MNTSVRQRPRIYLLRTFVCVRSAFIPSRLPPSHVQMLDMLKATARPESVVGWYHSHPGFGCWLSGVDCNTQQSFEQLHPRCVAVVVDPIQSVEGKVVIDAFRLINPQVLMMGQEPRQTTSNLGYLNKPSLQALIHGLNRHYYSLNISYRKNELEEQMLMNLHKKKWTAGLSTPRFDDAKAASAAALEEVAALSATYAERVAEEETKTPEEVALAHVGQVDPKKRLAADVDALLTANVVGCAGAMLNHALF